MYSDVDWGGPSTTDQHRHLFQILQSCEEGMEVSYAADKWLYENNIISDDPPNFALAQLESTLLQLAAAKNVVEGIFYSFAIPTGSGDWFVRCV